MLARRFGSYLELVEGTGAGETFSGAEDLRAALSRMLADPQRSIDMGRAAYALFRSRYSEDVVIPQYLALLDRLGARTIGAPSLTAPRRAAHV